MTGSVYEAVTERVMDALKRGETAWVKPWRGGIAPSNLVSRKPYRGVNALLLGLSEHSSPYWVTYRQAEGLGGHVKKGEHGTRIYFWKPIPGRVAAKKDADDSSGVRNPHRRTGTLFAIRETMSP